METSGNICQLSGHGSRHVGLQGAFQIWPDLHGKKGTGLQSDETNDIYNEYE